MLVLKVVSVEIIVRKLALGRASIYFGTHSVIVALSKIMCLSFGRVLSRCVPRLVFDIVLPAAMYPR